ncbi:MAG: biotin/lipoyl-containing protein [Acidobacteriota bacterium]
MELIVRSGEREEDVSVERLNDGTYRVELGDTTYELDVATAGDILSLREADGRQHEIVVRRNGRSDRAAYSVSSRRGIHVVEVMDPLARLAESAQGDSGSRRVEAMMPGRVVDVLVAEGDTVESGQGIVVIEAMKMKNEIPSESSGTVVKIFVEVGQNVEGGDPLFEIGDD